MAWDIDAEDIANFIESDEVLYLESLTCRSIRIGRPSWRDYLDVAQAGINQYRDTCPPAHKVTCDAEDVARELHSRNDEN